MDSTVIVAIISGLCVGIPSLVATVVSNKNSGNLLLYRIAQLEEKQDKHNSVIERVAVVERDLKTAFNHLTDVKAELHDIRNDINHEHHEHRAEHS